MSLEPHEKFWNSKMKILDLNHQRQIFEGFACDFRWLKRRAVGNCCVVPRFNCSDQMTYQTTAQIFMGLAQATTVIPCSKPCSLSIHWDVQMVISWSFQFVEAGNPRNPRLNQVIPGGSSKKCDSSIVVDLVVHPFGLAWKWTTFTPSCWP